MSIDTDFPGLTTSTIAAIGENAAFFLENYDVIENRVIAARGQKEVLGQKPQVCRFCSRATPDVTFRKEAHAVPELAGNRTLVSLYECDECNDRFSAFEGDLGKLTLLERVAGQVLGKNGVPSAKTRQKKSRIDLTAGGFKIEEHEGDPIAEIDEEKRTLTISITPQKYRPLGVYKALAKIALTLMNESDLAKVPEALRWLRRDDLTTDQIDDGTRYTCWRSWTPGPAPFANSRVFLLRRKHDGVQGPTFIFLLAFGNLSFQVVVPAPQEDKALIGAKVSLRPIPIFAFLDKARVKGPTRFWYQSLASPDPEDAPGSIVFKFDSMTELTAPGTA